MSAFRPPFKASTTSAVLVVPSWPCEGLGDAVVFVCLLVCLLCVGETTRENATLVNLNALLLVCVVCCVLCVVCCVCCVCCVLCVVCCVLCVVCCVLCVLCVVCVVCCVLCVVCVVCCVLWVVGCGLRVAG